MRLSLSNRSSHLLQTLYILAVRCPYTSSLGLERTSSYKARHRQQRSMTTGDPLAVPDDSSGNSTAPTTAADVASSLAHASLDEYASGSFVALHNTDIK